MKTRTFDSTGREVSEIGLGTWQLGGAEWGEVSEPQALETLRAAAEEGITFIDTADIYGDGRSERLIGRFLKERPDRERFFVATKLGRRSDPGWPGNFEPDTVRRHTEDSLARLGVESLDLTQTHCISHEAMKNGGIFDALRQLKREGLIKAFGASVESMEEARTCLEVDELASLQIIFNVFRQKPIEELFEHARRQRVAIIVRLPLASGLLSGKFTREQKFGEKDHRNFNRDGQAFNVGETFAGIAFDKGVELADALKSFVPAGSTMAQWALRWCLDFDAVTTVIPGATRPEQARQNASASAAAPLGSEVHARLQDFYRREIAQHVRGSY